MTTSDDSMERAGESSPGADRTTPGVNDALEHPIFKLPAKEDQGAVSYDGFGFQHDCLTKCAIRMLGDETIVAVVCETHEDGVLVFANGDAELVSCKARSASKPFTVNALLDDGGVLHLFDRWDYTGRSCRCRLMTDGALQDGDAKQLVGCCHRREPDALRSWGELLASRFGESAAVVTEFLGGLTVQNQDLAPRQRLALIISFHDLQRHLRAAKLDPGRHLDYYDVIRSAVQQRCRAAVADPWDGRSLLEASRRPHEAAQRARLRARSLDRENVVSCLSEDPPHAALDAAPDAVDHTRMVPKLEHGDLGPVGIAAAKRLRASWFEFESARRLRAPGAQSGFEDLRARVLLVAAEAEADIERQEPYGDRLLRELRGRLTTDAVAGATVQGLTPERLLGLAFQLTDECEIFWSVPFDVDAELT